MLRYLLPLFVISGSLFAENHPGPGSFGFTGEYLYLMPTVDDTYFVTKSDATSAFPQGRRENNNFNFKSGYRLSGAYAFCDCGREVALTYATLSTSQTKTVSGDFLWASLGRADFTSNFENYAGSANSHLNLFWQRLDPTFSQNIFSCSGANLRLQLGLEYALLRLRERYTFQSATNLGTINQNSRTWGIGPEFGFEFDYDLFQFQRCIPGKLSFTFLSTASILAGQTRTNNSNALNGDSLLDSNDKKGWRVIPAVHARVGFNYEACICNHTASLGVGYEFNSYFRGLARTEWPDDVSDGLVSTNYYNFDVQGLYVSASVNF